jgi:hypothetical protein
MRPPRPSGDRGCPVRKGAAPQTYNYLHGVECFFKSYTLSTSQEIPHILWKPKVHYRAHNSPPTLPILSHNYPVQISPTPSCFLKPNFIFILPSTPRSYKWFFPSRFPHKHRVYTSSFPIREKCPLISFLLMCHPNNIWWAVKIRMLLGMKYPPFFLYCFPFGPNTLTTKTIRTSDKPLCCKLEI